jgi:PAS domain S-box-containing protein
MNPGIPASPFGSGASVRSRVAWVLSAYVVITAGVLAALMLQLRSDAIVSGKKLLTAVAQLTDEQTSRTLQNVEQGLKSADAILSAATGAGAVNADEIDAELHRLVADRPYLTVIRVLDASGRAIYASDTGRRGLDLSDRAYFIQRRDGLKTGFQFGAPIRNRVSAKWIIPATQTVRAANGDFAGVIVAGVDPLYFNRVWSLDEEIPDLTITLFRTDGVMLMRSPFDERLFGASYSSLSVFQRMQGGIHAGNFESASAIDGETRLFAFHQLAAYPELVLVVGQAMGQALGAWWRIVWIVVAGWIVTTLAVGGLAVWLIRLWAARRATQERYRLLFEANPYPMVVAEQGTMRYLAVNDAAVRQYGWSREEFLAMTSFDVRTPETVPALTAALDADVLRPGEIVPGHRHRKKDGTVIDVEIALRTIEFDGRPAVLSLSHDITERLRTERARDAAEEQLRQAQKMEAVGQLTGGIAHDFNNILTLILANADALQEEEGLAPEVVARLARIGKAVLRASELTRQLLAFSRKQTLRPQRTDINELVTNTGKLLRRALGEQVEIESVLADDLGIVNIDRAQLETALVNLCVNARDAMPSGGRLRIATRNATLDEDYVARHPGALAGDYVLLSVTDTGTGIPADVVDKVFEPFFTTKEVGKGTGLGLSMVYGFITQSNGYIMIDSEVGRGTTFCLFLPRSEGAKEEAAIQQRPRLAGGTERILVVEDDREVRASVVQQLQSLGYVVLQAPDGTAAIASFEAAPRPYDLLLTDIVMPGALSGNALADEVARRWPTTRIVFISGYAENAIARDGRLGAGALLLNKPFRKDDLAEIVRQALDRAGEAAEIPAAAS